jgi:DNA primase
MAIAVEDVQRVREATDLVALISERSALRRSGRRFVGLCPFHTERTPSFSVNPELGVYYCFGCGASGDAITFVRVTEGLDFPEAVEALARRAGIELPDRDTPGDEARRHRERLADAVAAAADFYHERLLGDPAARAARDFLRDRGFTGDHARRFRLGWAPEGFDTLVRHLYDRRFRRDELVAAGLAFENRAGRLQDFFRARLMFPISDHRGRAVAFGGRALGGDGPKYKNTPDGPLYHKSRLLYWFAEAKAEISAAGAVVVCEGYTDVMAFVAAGVPHAVATCGTAVTEEHVQALLPFTRRFLLAYDADAAGQAATERWYRWEERYDLDVRVVELGAGRDPGDVYRDDPAALAERVRDAEPLLRARLARVLERHDLQRPEGRARAAAAAVPVLAEHPSELLREDYIREVAGRLGYEHAWFKREVARRRAGGAAPAVPPDPPGADRGRAEIRVRREAVALRLHVQHPELTAGWLGPHLLTDEVAREVWDLLERSGSLEAALATDDERLGPALRRLVNEEPVGGADPDVTRTSLMLDLAVPVGERLLEALVAAEDARASECKRRLDPAVTARADGDWANGREVAEELVRFLTGWSGA